MELFNSSNDGVETTTRNRDTSLVYGYRFEDKALVYTGVSYSDFDLDGNVTKVTNINSNFEYDSEVMGAHLGLMAHNKNFLFKLELSVQETKWSNSEKQGFGFIAAQVGFRWE